MLNLHPTTYLDMLPAPIAPHLPRRQRRDLQPLEIVRSTEYERRLSVQSTAALPSPSLVAARAYLLQQIPPIGQNLDALQRRGSLFEVQQIPRKHSILAPSGGESGQTTIDEPPRSQDTQATEDTALAASTDVKIKIEKEDDGPASLGEASEVKQVRYGPEKDVHGIWSQAKLKVPFQFSHDHLREWGNEFLGNAATADAWVNAVSLRRPSLAVENSGRKSPSNLVTIRARVVPKSKDRKPLLITKQFDIEALRAAIPPIAQTEGELPVFLRRSSRARRSSTQHTNICLRRGSTDSQLGIQSLTLEKTSVPIRKYFFKKIYRDPQAIFMYPQAISMYSTSI